MRKNEAFHSGCWSAAIDHKEKRGLSPITRYSLTPMQLDSLYIG